MVAAAAGPMAALHVMPEPSAALAQGCQGGEENDQFTMTCVPFMVPNSPPLFQTTAANPDVPEIQGIPCIGHNAGGCLGLAEDEAAAGPPAQPRSTISASP
ncbi:hypothetical protein AU190_14565 [Mycolicibacterium acapulense]|uniref:Intersectin-EH binding protein Ibp1 n=2 Tax=Mycobacterium lehmannii TaxID=2048550 RepID=A0A124ENM2_9MYCO|nr:hypothetical protein AU190_14565 [Mycolicibacterium acapulense]KUI10859.1 hypothetical protein AU192_21765 [Mycobacterium lehmannii]